jgi:ABC-type antimicrobial peptide transport system permease subunit
MVMRSEDEEENDSASVEIPGLVIEIEEDGSGDVVGVYEKTSVFDDAVKTGDIMTIKVSSIFDRSQVVESLNEEGYAYTDTNDLELFENVQSTLEQVSTIVMIAFVVISVLVIILTMSKFVSESTKEIGIYRAVGFTKNNILIMFLLQSFIYTGFGYLVGLGIGLAGNLAASKIASTWFDNVVASTVKEKFGVVADVDYSTFTQVDLTSIGVLSLVLFIIVVVISFVPAYRASTISPVEAIKSE